MRQRAISSIGVVVVSLVPAVLGGPVFALAMLAIMLIAAAEFVSLAARAGARPGAGLGVAVAVFALAAYADAGTVGIVVAAAIAVALPLVAELVDPGVEPPLAVQRWALTTAGTLYLGLPLFAAIDLRRLPGATDAAWLNHLASVVSPGWAANALGLGWLLTVIVVTWFSDTGAYLVGRAIGRRPLLPRASPKKTVEGAAGGLLAAALAGAGGVALGGLGVPWWGGALIGLALGTLGQIGDLAESLLKRQVGVKDSGTLIPGHGGMLDRIDALLVVLMGGWLVATLVEQSR